MSEEKKAKLSLYLDIYKTFFKLGCFSFGGGYAMLSLIEREVVGEKKWVDKEKIVDIFAVAGSLPGAIALNASAFAGYSIAKVPGAIVALLGNLTPSVMIVLTLAILMQEFGENVYVQAAFNGIRPAIIGLIAYAAFKIAKTAIKDYICAIIAVIVFISATFFHIPPIPLIVFGAIAGITITLTKASIRNKKEEEEVK